VTQIAAIDLEEGDFTDFDSTVNSADMAVNGSAAMVGSYGLEISGIDSGEATYGLQNATVSTSTLRWRFYFDPNSLSMSSGDSILSCQVIADGTYLSITDWGYTEFLHNGSNYQLTPNVRDDNDSSITLATATISDAEHYIELMVTRESSDGAANGTFEYWVDGVSIDSSSSIENYNMFPTLESFTLGFYWTNQANTGSIYYDDLIANDDGSEIGQATETLLIEISKNTTYKQGVKIYP